MKFFFPDHGISIEADSREEAYEKIEAKTKKKSKSSPRKS